MTDVEILQQQYFKYKDKNGKKAKNLKCKIDAYLSFSKLLSNIKFTKEEVEYFSL